MYSIRSIILFFTLVSVCYSQEPGTLRPAFSLISGFRDTTSPGVVSTTAAPVPPLILSNTSSAPAATVTVDNGENVIVLPGVVVVGAGVGGFYTVNGVTTPIAAGVSVVAGSQSSSNPNDPEPDPPKSDDPEPATTTTTTTTITTSSATPRATSADYIIFAKENTVKADGDGFGITLAGLVGADNMDTIVDDAGAPFVWRANLTPDQLEKVKADRVVAGADINDPLTRDNPGSSATRRKRAEIAQSPIANNDIFDLRTLSTPPKQKDPLPDYRYDEFAGNGITVYVVDTGPFDLQNAEFAAPSADVTRRELNVAKNKRFSLQDTQHGTCVASKVVGVTTGTAKRANLVCVRIDFTEFGLFRGLQAAFNDIKQKGLKGKAVVTTSILMRAPEAIYTTSMRSVIRGLINLDVPVVAAAGNRFRDGFTEPDKLPAIMAEEFPVIVVGSAGRDFQTAPTSQRGNLVTTFAIGADIKCADPLDQTGLVTDSGTSFAAPQVAGMVAYWMSHPEFVGNLGPGLVAETLRNMTGALSYPRVAEPGFPPIAWKGHDLAELCAVPNGAASRRAKSGMRRDLGQACSLVSTSVAAAPTSAPAVPPVASVTSVAPAPPVDPEPKCNLCGAETFSGSPGTLGGQVGCKDAEVARSACAADNTCKSWAFGFEDEGEISIPVCLLFEQSATQVVSQAPPDPEGKCPFRYNDKGCISS